MSDNTTDGVTTDPRDHLALALDVGDLRAALAIAERVRPWFGVAKVGFELYAEAGPAAFDALQDKGFRVFADLKLHDIPNTVHRAARVLGRRGVDFLNFHAAGGEAMVRAGVEGLAEGAREAGRAVPVALAVTVLTSDHDIGARDARMQIARDAGCDGVVCAGTDVEVARAFALRTMVPGIRLAGDAVNDQARVDTPDDAIARGADWLVIGRPVTGADDPEAAAREITRAVAEGLERVTA
jgi:orotidine-5'-phosphate decarboxylase